MRNIINIPMYYWAKIVKIARASAIKNSKVDTTSKIEPGSHFVNSTMERYSFCGYDCEISNCDIGSFCSIANEVIIGGGEHPTDWVSTSPVFYDNVDSIKTKISRHKRAPLKRTAIGDDVWIGRRAMVKQGVRIGTGAVIGMGSVVTKDVEPYSIVAGVPAKEIRKRFTKKTIENLLKSKWWTLSESQLKRKSFQIKDPNRFLES